MSRHTITWLRPTTRVDMDLDDEHEVTFEFRAGRPDVRTLPNALEVVSVSNAGGHGTFTSLSAVYLQKEAQRWLETDGYDEAMSIVLADMGAAREYAAEVPRAMIAARTLLLIGPAVALAGLILFTIYAPRARAADDVGRSPATHMLWVCEGAVSCRPRGKPQGQTACLLDAASLANTLPKGSKVACHRIAK